jgi:hypothetical protein
MEELWRPIPNYEGYYEASNLGRIRSVYRYKRVLKPMISNTGYERVDLFKNRHRKQYSVHRLVAITFVDNPDNKPFVNHRDENKINNCADNLEWVTHVENCRYGTAIERRTKHFDYSKRKINNAGQIEACSKPIAQYTKDGRFVRNWKSASECARKNGWQISNIRRCCKKEYATAYGFVFREVI